LRSRLLGAPLVIEPYDTSSVAEAVCISGSGPVVWRRPSDPMVLLTGWFVLTGSIAVADAVLRGITARVRTTKAADWLRTHRRHTQRVLRPLPRMQKSAGARVVPIDLERASCRDCA
jgi:hypothetical protein